MQAAGLAWIAAIAAPGVAYPSLVLPLVVTGIGASMAIPVVQNAVLGAVASSAVGKASGANSMTQELGGVFGVAILVVVFTAMGSYASTPAFIDGVAAALAVAGAVVALAVPRRDQATPPQHVAAGKPRAVHGC